MIGKSHRVKTYVRRESRITPAQKRALTELLDLYQLPLADSQFNISETFPQARRFAIEFGFGDGEFLVQQALMNNDTAYLGIEVFRPGVGKCLLNLHKNGIKNVRISTSDARDVLAQQIPSDSVNEIIILFPDPWPKARHRKRRLINAEFVALCVDRLVTNGSILMVTDSGDYADQARHLLLENGSLKSLTADEHQARVPAGALQTRYASKAVQSGNPIFELCFARN